MFVNTGTIMTVRDAERGDRRPRPRSGPPRPRRPRRHPPDRSPTQSTAALIGALLGVGAAMAGSAAGLGRPRPGRHRHHGRLDACRRSATSSPIRAPRKRRRPHGDRLSQRHRPVRAGHGRPCCSRLADEVLLSSRDADPYVQTHPLPADRLSTVEALVSRQQVCRRARIRRAAAPPRPGPRQARRLHPDPAAGRPPLPAERHQPAGPLRPRHRRLPRRRLGAGAQAASTS